MARTFTAVVFPEANRAELREFPLRAPRKGEVLARVVVSGVSIGTEYLVLSGQFPNQKFPCLVGYQSVGVVEEVGEGISHLRPGDRITIGSSEIPEGYHEGAGAAHFSHAVIPAEPGNDRAIIVPSHVSDDAASYFVLVSVAVEGIRLANVQRNDLVAVVGQGVLGQLVAQICRHNGATVFTSDLDPARVGISARYSAHRAFALDVPAFDEELRKVQKKGADVVFETTGNTKVFDQALTLARDYGTFVAQGHYPGNLTFRFVHAHWRHLRMMFPCGKGKTWESVETMARGIVNVDSLITHRVSPQDAPDLYAKIAARSPEILGATIRWAER
ncbi:MAG TPA: zinc-binding dehydrogenase [Candidatus Latescibacteria bacterium]|nr:zinc-binding dehydrogenase [Candidatus Latescibacterota bacterium]HQK22048.1 zinc-binding dehydrogenase [Candidatus Latescibacterota bacterium]